MFEIHPQLVQDTIQLGRVDSGHLLLHKERSVLWLILVPECEATEIHELESHQRAKVRQDMDRLSALVKSEPGIKKMNVAAIGNMVPQLHIHLIGRYPDDPYWPGVCWGQEPTGADWKEDEVDRLRRLFVEQAGA